MSDPGWQVAEKNTKMIQEAERSKKEIELLNEEARLLSHEFAREVEFVQPRIKLVSSNMSDALVLQAARVSTGARMDTDRDEGLIKYLLSNGHTSPFEHGSITFFIEAPLFVARQWMRHRIGCSYNEESGRYRELEPRFYMPFSARTQEGRPGQYEIKPGSPISTKSGFMKDSIRTNSICSWVRYKHLLNNNVPREQARLVLPLNIMTKFYWTCNPRSLMHFIDLRGDSHAQTEIQNFARSMQFWFEDVMPITARVYNELKAKKEPRSVPQGARSNFSIGSERRSSSVRGKYPSLNRLTARWISGGARDYYHKLGSVIIR